MQTTDTNVISAPKSKAILSQRASHYPSRLVTWLLLLHMDKSLLASFGDIGRVGPALVHPPQKILPQVVMLLRGESNRTGSWVDQPKHQC